MNTITLPLKATLCYWHSCNAQIAQICLEWFSKKFLYEWHQKQSNQTPEYIFSLWTCSPNTLHIVHLVLPDMVCVDFWHLLTLGNILIPFLRWEHSQDGFSHPCDRMMSPLTRWYLQLNLGSKPQERGRGGGGIFFLVPKVSRRFQSVTINICIQIWLGTELITFCIRTVMPQDHQVLSSHI
jgi:hypothetical protein